MSICSEVAIDVTCTLDRRSKAVVPMRDEAPAVDAELLSPVTVDIVTTIAHDIAAKLNHVMILIIYHQRICEEWF